MQSNVSQRLMVVLEKRQRQHSSNAQAAAWIERTWRLLTLGLGHWLIAHAPPEPERDEGEHDELIDVASMDSFPASDPPAWIGGRRNAEPLS